MIQCWLNNCILACMKKTLALCLLSAIFFAAAPLDEMYITWELRGSGSHTYPLYTAHDATYRILVSSEELCCQSAIQITANVDSLGENLFRYALRTFPDTIDFKVPGGSTTTISSKVIALPIRCSCMGVGNHALFRMRVLEE
jgi:hypothetical protein